MRRILQLGKLIYQSFSGKIFKTLIFFTNLSYCGYYFYLGKVEASRIGNIGEALWNPMLIQAPTRLTGYG